MSATTCEIRSGAAWITLNQPERRNALSDELVLSLLAHLRDALASSAVRSIVITGAGKAFCAGADLKGGGIKATDEETPFVTLLKTIWNAPKPIIACVNGPAFGGGVGLAAACDLVVASDTAQFSFSEVRIGVIPAMISVVVLPKLGVHNAMWLFLTGERFDARRAVELGLVHRAVTADELIGSVEQVIDMIRQGGPEAISAAKRLVRDVPGMSMDAAFAHTQLLIGRLFSSAEAAEGMQAFVEKRKPCWASAGNES